MRYLVAHVTHHEKREGILCTENGIVLRRREGDAAAPESLLQGLPKGRVAVYLGGGDAEAQADWRVQRETEREALFRGYNMEKAGMALVLGETATLLTSEGDKEAPYGSQFALDRALHLAKSDAASYFRYALEVATGLPMCEIEAFLNEMPAKKRLSYARVLQKGYYAGEEEARQIGEEALRGYLSLLSAAIQSAEDGCPLYIEGTTKADRAEIRQRIERELPGRFSMQKAEMPPMFYAACAAAALFKIEPDERFRRRFSETYSIFRK